MSCAGRTEWSSTEWFSTEWSRFWLRGGTEHLYARYITYAFTPHTDEGWLYRTLYPSAETVAEAVKDISGRAEPPFFPRAVVYDPGLAQKVWRYHLLSEHEDELALEAAFLELI